MRTFPAPPRRAVAFTACSAVLVAATAVISPAAARADDDAAVANAWSWVQRQAGTGTPLVGRSTITAARDYPADWTGAVSGTFKVRGVSAPAVVDPASVVVDTPVAVPANYAGVVTGHVTLAPKTDRWIVQAYRDTASGRVQAPVQALVDPQGRFSIDLGRAGAVPDGTWTLGLLDADAAYAPAGTAWPAAPIYSGWVVRAYVVTDTAYEVGEQPARADGTFVFPDSRPGTKVFQLVRTSDGAVLAEDAPDYGLLRSFAGGTRCYAYDQALAVLAGSALGADVSSLVSGLLSLQAPDGGFLDSADVRDPSAGEQVERTGVAAVATYALLRDLATTPANAPDRAAVEAGARAGLAWLLAQRRPDGLLGAGVDAGDDPAWVSTEHNLDAWQTFRYAAVVLSDDTFDDAAKSLATSIVARLWNSAAGRFREGLQADDSADDTDPLDVNSWGALFLRASGHADLADQALAHVAAFASSARNQHGYRAYHPQPAFPTVKANVWAEGTAGVALARVRAGDAAADDDLDALAGLQRSGGALPYAVVADPATSMTDTASVAATTWFVLVWSASQGGPSIWDPVS